MTYPSHMDFVVEKMSGELDDWLDAIDALGVRYVKWNGRHNAYLGADKPSWTNATVARFETKDEAQDWCRLVNEKFGPFGEVAGRG